MPGTPATQFAEGITDKLIFEGDILNGLFIEHMPVCSFRHGLPFMLLLFFHDWARVSITKMAADYYTLMLNMLFSRQDL
jgi:hypothetical protein